MANFLNQLRYDAMRSISDANPFEKAVWKDELPQELAQPGYTFLFSGPPTVPAALELQKFITPIGMITSVNPTSSRQLQGIKELGNRYTRYVGGAFQHAVTLNRVLGRDANLVGMLYRWAYNLDSKYHSDPAGGQWTYRQMVGLDSDLLNVPFGLYLVMMTENLEPISAEYWERCMIGQHAKPISTDQIIIMEYCQIAFSRIVPMKNMVIAVGGEQAFNVGANNDAIDSPTQGPGGSASFSIQGTGNNAVA